MKKLALILAFLVIPCAAFGLEMLNDSSMDAITGQSGVHIAVDDIQMFINIEKLAYIDCDGYVKSATCSGRAAAIYLNQFQIDTLMINAILDEEGGTDALTQNDPNEIQTEGQEGVALYSALCGSIPLQYDYGTGRIVSSCYLNSASAFLGAGLDNMYNDQFTPSAITIDVTEALPMLTQALQQRGGTFAASTMGGVLIGLPTVELQIGTMTIQPTFTANVTGAYGTQTSVAYNEGKDFGSIYIQGLTVSLLSGWLEIAPH